VVEPLPGDLAFACSQGCTESEIRASLVDHQALANEAALTAADTARTRSQIIDGATFAFNTGEFVPAIRREGQQVAWSQGEPFFLVGPPGVGKTTLAQRLALARAGIRDDDLLGLPVVPDAGGRCFTSPPTAHSRHSGASSAW